MPEMTPSGEMLTPAEQAEMTAGIVAAFVANNAVPAADLPGIIRSVHGAVVGLGSTVEIEPAKPLVPAVPVKKSITDSHIFSLLDGKPYKSLKRHIGIAGYTPASYRTAFGLSPDYPMVAPDYARVRSELARTMGLGRAKVAA